MKHDSKVTILLVVLFLVSQYVGLFITSQYVEVTEQVDPVTGEVSFNATSYAELPYGMESPDISPYTFLLILVFGILIGTGIVLLLAKFRKPNAWKIWYFISVFYIMSLSLAKLIGETPARITAAILAISKVWYPNIFVHNITEVFLYSGLAIVFLKILTIPVAFLLLIIISIYDAIAVWRSKHMITLAKFQSDANVFAGIFVPYQTNHETHTSKFMFKMPKKESKKHPAPSLKKHSHVSASKEAKHSKSKIEVGRAILGGGDIAFPLVFTTVVMKTFGLYKVLLIPPFVAIALFLLLYYGKKGKYYPAMPFISAGCFVGFVVAKFAGIIFNF